jgi:hypothetical protein
MTNFERVLQPDLIPGFLQVSPEFAVRWKKRCDYWCPDRAGAYNDLAAELAHFVIDGFEEGRFDIVTRPLDYTERLLEKKEPQTTKLLIIRLLEDIQTIAPHHSFEPDAFVEYLGPISLQGWREIAKMWEGTKIRN